MASLWLRPPPLYSLLYQLHYADNVTTLNIWINAVRMGYNAEAFLFSVTLEFIVTAVNTS